MNHDYVGTFRFRQVILDSEASCWNHARKPGCGVVVQIARTFSLKTSIKQALGWTPADHWEPSIGKRPGHTHRGAEMAP